LLRSNTIAQDNNRRLDLAWKYTISLYVDSRYREAEKPFQQLFKARNRVLGEEHPDMLTSMANLASTYRNQGRWKEAEELFVRVLETSLRILGEEHPDTLTSMANLASTYRN
jgi:tetratricopeptide (TPR) repeat protein